jgi:hypothetical protein
MVPPNRTIHHADALDWLARAGTLDGCSLITSMPDFSEFPSLSIPEWKSWFVSAAALVLSVCPDDGVVIFYQTDSKKDGAWVDKAYLCQRAAEQTGHGLLWHKIVCRAPVGNTTFGRPGYSHLLCFSKGLKAEISRSTQDVLPLAGKSTWTRGMGEQACLFACRFILENTATRTIVDPFCGHGLVLAIANSMGLDAVGVELSRKRVKKARSLELGDHSLLT